MLALPKKARLGGEPSIKALKGTAIQHRIELKRSRRLEVYGFALKRPTYRSATVGPFPKCCQNHEGAWFFNTITFQEVNLDKSPPGHV